MNNYVPTTTNGSVILDWSRDLVGLPFRLMVKVPEKMYQSFYAMAQTHPDRQWTRRSILLQLNEWVPDKYPGYGMVAFEDYSSDEATAASLRTGYPLTWGMYLVIELGAPPMSMAPQTVTDKLLDSPLKTISNGNKEKNS